MPHHDERLIHVAGVIDQQEAEMLIDCGVDWLGFPLVLGYHREDLSIDEAAAIVAALGHRARFFLITYLRTAAAVIELCRRLSVGCVQLHGDIDEMELRNLRDAWPTLRVIKSLIVRADNGERLAAEASKFSPLVDAFITDTFDPSTGATGATGKVHDWNISRQLVESSLKPVILAGGLNPSNVSEAIRRVRPSGVDVHTGIEGPDGRKRSELTKSFLKEASRAWTA